MLAQLQAEQPFENAEIITLAFHVDYWDYLGWKDKFSSAEFSQRQNDYSISKKLKSNYTPQMIVDGTVEFVGSKKALAIKEIAKAAENEKAEIEFFIDKNGSSVKLKINNISLSEDADLWLAIAEDELETNVERGENSGQNLKHTAVVRALEKIGEITHEDNEFSKSLSFELKPNWKKEHLRFVAFVQGRESKKIYGLGQLKLGK